MIAALCTLLACVLAAAFLFYRRSAAAASAAAAKAAAASAAAAAKAAAKEKKRGKGGRVKPKTKNPLQAKGSGRAKKKKRQISHPLFIADLKGHTDVVTSIAASRSTPAVIVTACEDRVIRVYKAAACGVDNNALRLKISGFTSAVDVSIDGDGRKVIAVLVDGSAIESWHLPKPSALGTKGAAARSLGTWKHEMRNTCTAMAIASADELSSAKLLAQPRPFLVTSDAPHTSLSFWGLKGKMISKFDTGSIRNRSVACSSDAEWCGVASFMSSVPLFRMVRTGGHGGDDLGNANVKVIKAGSLTGFHKKAIIDLAFGTGAAGVKKLITASEDRTWALWQLPASDAAASSAAPKRLSGGTIADGHTLTCVALSPDARLMVAGTLKGALIFINLEDGAIVDAVPEAHAGHAVTKVVCVPGLPGFVSLAAGATYASAWRFPTV